MTNSITKNFNILSLLKFALPTIIMALFVEIYATVDGIFISTLVGSDALCGLNIIYPVIHIFLGLGVMFGTGGSAIVAKKIGENKQEEGKSNFTLLVVSAFIIGFILAMFSFIFIKQISYFLGANEQLIKYSIGYGKYIFLLSPFLVLQLMFQMFFITAGKPKIGLMVNFLAGLSNAILDYIFIVKFDMGIDGASLGTALSFLIGSIYPLIYFKSKKNKNLHFTKIKFDINVILTTMSNGASEMIVNVSLGIITYLFNITMMKYLGANGVAAITIISYAQAIFLSIYLGFSNAVAPIFSYNYGNQNTQRLKKLFKMAFLVIITCSIIICILSFSLSNVAIGVFVEKGSKVYDIATNGFNVFAWNFLFAGINIFASSFFTALSNGKISAKISFSRVFLFQVLYLLLLPNIIGINGIWISVPLAEISTLFISITEFKRNKHIYKYA